jgi:hypothetical protein
MLEEFEEAFKQTDIFSVSIEQRWHPGKPQDNRALRYLDFLRARNDAAFDAGFAAVLSDALVQHSSMTSAARYSKTIKRAPFSSVEGETARGAAS